MRWRTPADSSCRSLHADACGQKGEFVELGAAIVLRGAPTRLEQTLTDEAKEAGIERALFDQQRVVGDLSDAQKDAVPMQRAE
jgi:hypothetical protein